MKTPIADFLNKYKADIFLRCHMPGSKGRNYPGDITEVFGADSLYDSCEIIAESERNAAAVFGGSACAYSCSGSTLAIQAMLSYAKIHGGNSRIIAGRYSHRSLIDSAVLFDLDIEWIYPLEYLSANISMDAISAKLSKFPNTNLFLTSIDYYGGQCDISHAAGLFAEKKTASPNITGETGAISPCEQAHEQHINKQVIKNRSLLLVDNAHGAYKAFTGNHPIQKGVSFCADSAHKTLPVLTGGAYLHMNDKNRLPQIKKEMAMLGTTSPSYLIMESLDLCNRHLKYGRSSAKFSFQLVNELKAKLSHMGFSLYNSDELRITINAPDCGYSGFELARLLCEKRLMCEMCDDTYVVLLFSTVTNEQEMMKIAEIFKEISIKGRLTCDPHIILKPLIEMRPRDAYFSKRKQIALSRAKGEICGEILAPCPPGIPLIMPGERIDDDCITELLRYGYLPDSPIYVC